METLSQGSVQEDTQAELGKGRGARCGTGQTWQPLPGGLVRGHSLPIAWLLLQEKPLWLTSE